MTEELCPHGRPIHQDCYICEMLAALKLARAIIGHPDDSGSKFIAAAITKAEQQK